MAVPTDSKLEQLQNADVIESQGVTRMSQEQRDKIEALSQEEVDTLIAVREKVGPIEFGARLI